MFGCYVYFQFPLKRGKIGPQINLSRGLMVTITYSVAMTLILTSYSKESI